MRVAIILGVLLCASLAMPLASAKNSDPCNTFWYADEEVGPVHVYTNGNPNCTGGDVYLPAIEQCIREGTYHPLRTIGAITFHEYRCG